MFFVAVLYSLFSYLHSTALPPNYLITTRSKYGDVIFSTIRKVEKLSLKHQKCKCDLEFIRLCIIYKLIPTFVKIALWKKRIKKSNEYKSLQQYCLQQEYQSRLKDNLKYEKESKELLRNLESILNLHDFNQLQKFLHERSKQLKEKTIIIHNEKLKSLNNNQPVGQDYESLKTKLIHNISSYTLSSAEERILCRGWEFCVENKLNNFIDFKTDIELNVKKLQPLCHSNAFTDICFNIRNYSETLMKSIKKKNIRNISDDEFNALKSLKNNQNIVICRADKGNCIVVLNKDDYNKKAEDILKLKQFTHTRKSLLTEKEKDMNKYILKLLKDKVIDKQLYWRIHSTSSSIATMYGQPKIHKLNYPLRPIISSIGSYNHELSKYLAELIKNNRTSSSPSFIKDSFDFVRKICDINDSKDQLMISFDVDNLYTNVPVHESIKIALDIIYKRDHPPPIPFDRSQLKHLLELAVTNIPFRFLNKTYVQTDGVAMGSPLGPILADIFMTNLETKLNKFSTNKPSLWIRYVDDIFCIFKKHQNINDFLKRINKWHPNITFTIEYETNDKLAFLDVLVIRDNTTNKYTTTIYRKPTNTNLYLLYDSNQCRKYKLGLIRTLVIRILLICSTPTYKNNELSLMKLTLKMNGYPEHLIRRGIREGEVIVKKILNKSLNQQQNSPNKKNIFFTLTYYGIESTILAQRIRRICLQYLPLYNVNIAFKKTYTLKSIFLPIQKGQDKTKINKKLIYKIPCINCNKSYIGETNREKSTRMKEHEKDIRKLSNTSNVAKHVIEHNHSFNFNKVETLALENNWNRRIIKESLYTHQSLEKSLNDVKFKLNVFG